MTRFVKVAEVADLPPGERLFHDFDYETVVVFNIDGTFYAIADVCTHDDGPLGDGELDGCHVVCPRHGARFDLRTGAGTMPAVRPAPIYAVKVEDGAVYVAEPEY